MRAIIYTSHTGGVEVCHPAQDCLRAMSYGLWREKPVGFLDEQIARQVAAGHHEHAAVRFARALAFGGLTEAEALDVIRDRDCGHWGTAHDVIDPRDLPDRWFRDAWTRGHNGGPIGLDLRKARAIQFQKIMSRMDIINKKRRMELDGEPVVLNLDDVRYRIKKADDDTDLRRIWPEPLGAP